MFTHVFGRWTKESFKNIMKEQDLITRAVHEAIREVNELLPQSHAVPEAPDTVLIGKSSKLDSMGLINLMLAVEKNVEQLLRKEISLVGGMGKSEAESPLRTVGTLRDYVAELLEND